jgi:hypothetical protein
MYILEAIGTAHLQCACRCPLKMLLEQWPLAEALLDLEMSLYVFSDAR